MPPDPLRRKEEVVMSEADALIHVMNVKIMALTGALGFELFGMGSLLRYAAQSDQRDTYHKEAGILCVCGGALFLALALH